MAELISLQVNGKQYQVNVDQNVPLLYVLRNDLGFKGVKYACGQEQCGACKVLIDGQAVPSCKLHVGAAQGAEITTIEGLGTPQALHPLQEAFIEEQATQCGYCTAGLIITAQGLLNKHRYPTEDQINQALDGNLCRCGTHERVRRAIKLRIARPEPLPLFESIDLEPIPSEKQELPSALLNNPEIDSWIRIDENETITVFSGKVEYGQGIKTALAQVAAEELDVALERIQMVMADTERTPDEGMTVGSMSMETSGNAIRQVAAEARYVLLYMALEELEASFENLVVKDGLITNTDNGKSISYWEIQGGKKFNLKIKNLAQPKSHNEYKLIGSPAKRLDMVSKSTGTHTFVQDMNPENMVHARVVRPPSYHDRLISIDSSSVEKMPGVLKVVRDGSFLGVIAERETQAGWAMEKLTDLAVWDNNSIKSRQENLFEDIEAQIDESHLIVNGTGTLDRIPPIKAPDTASQTISATYTKPYQMHATLAPSSALAHMQNDKLTIWCHSQGAFPPRDKIASVLKMPPGNIHVIHTEGSGCYGHNGAEDAALDAALLALAFPGRPVLLKWTRANENQWEPYSPPALLKMQASINAQGQIIDWNHDVYSPPHVGRGRGEENTSGMVAAWHLEEPIPPAPLWSGPWPNFGAHRNADPIYDFSKKRIAKHIQLEPPLRVSSFRGLGAYANIFALESFMDEVAAAAGIDPVEFRLRNLKDPRAIAVIEAAAEKADWGSLLGVDQGRGIAFSRYSNRAAYCAVVVELSVSRENGAIGLERAFIIGESGQAVNPDGLSNQLEGGFIQSASMTLKEQVNFNAEGITSVDWETYPILTFSETPKIETLILNRPGSPFLGTGEASIGPAAAAIANAVYDAVGIRLRDIPFLPEKVMKLLESL